MVQTLRALPKMNSCLNTTLSAARLAQENTSCEGSCYQLNYANNLLEFLDELGQSNGGLFLAKVFVCW